MTTRPADTANVTDQNARLSLTQLVTAAEYLLSMFPAGGFCGDRDELRTAIQDMANRYGYAFYHAAVALQVRDDKADGVTVGGGDFGATIYEIPARYGINTPMEERPYIHNRWGLDDGG